MKSIKFRAWSPQLKQMLGNDEWVHPSYSYLDVNSINNLMQFTGLLDKNGKEIYEDDLVVSSNSIGRIVFDKGRFKINWTINNDFFNDSLEYHSPYIEVVGNVYENLYQVTKAREQKGFSAKEFLKEVTGEWKQEVNHE